MSGLESDDRLASRFRGTDCGSHCGYRFLHAALDCAPTDILAELHAVEMNLLDRLVRLVLRHLDAIAQADYAEHAPAGRAELAIMQRGPGVEGHAFVGFGRDAGDLVALARRVRVAGSCHHHAQRGAAIPFQVDAVERAVDGVFKDRQQIASSSAP